jgi:yecA family protein
MSPPATSPDLHQRVERVLRDLGCDIGASECHGMLCGMLSGPARFDRAAWLTHVSGGDDLHAYTSGEPDSAFDALIGATTAALAASDYSFELLLPGDERSLAERAGAFAGWCRGFLSGLGLSGIADAGALGEDAREFLADVQRFGTLASEAVGDEDDERAFAELTEFTRIGVLVVRAASHDDPDDAEEPADIH